MRVAIDTPNRHAFIVLVNGKKVENLAWADEESGTYQRIGHLPKAGTVRIFKRPDTDTLNPVIELTPEVWENEISNHPGKYAVEWAEPQEGLDTEGRPMTAGYTVRTSIADALAAARLHHAKRDCSDISEYDMLVDLLVIHWGSIISLYVPFDPSTLTSHGS